MASLLIFPENRDTFDDDQVLGFVRSLEGISDVRERETEKTRFSAEFGHEGDFTQIIMGSGLKSISCGHSPAGIEFAWRVQKGIPGPLRVIDDSYVVDFLLEGFERASDLAEAIRKAWDKPGS